MKHPDIFYDFYFSKMVYPDALPNNAHLYFAELQKTKNVTIVTQNIDNLHQMAGSKNVIELHGSIARNYCMKCHKYYNIKDILKFSPGIPYCDCNGIIKPDVVLYEEALKEDDIVNAVRKIGDADMLIIVGTSLVVQPAASFIRYYNKDKLVLLNKSKTSYDSIANLVINDDIKRIIDELNKK